MRSATDRRRILLFGRVRSPRRRRSGVNGGEKCAHGFWLRDRIEWQLAAENAGSFRKR
jgi:hypothetical protein